ncbi:uncharacterized protein [Rutidosis leptorrhynchoides]|uniref:uncharacterized protein n=1 Tax=Rutidosis leptorrhynchoides TaxID=125765 RepID=UPI003A99DD7D
MRDRVKNHVHVDNDGGISWITSKGKLVPFKTSQVWEDLRPNLAIVPWHQVVWFPQANPKHAFIMWLVICGRLTTQDKLGKWYPNKCFSCVLCGKEEDSIKHLFFACEYSKKVWLEIKNYLIFRGLPSNIHDIVHTLAGFPLRNQIWDVINRISIAATVYHIWQERNCRIFKGGRRPEKEIVQCIVDGIRMKLSTLFVKNSSAIRMAAKKWGMDLDAGRLKMKNG